MVVKADIITLTNEDILNSLSQFVYGIDFAAQEELNNKNINTVFDNFRNVHIEYEQLRIKTRGKRDER